MAFPEMFRLQDKWEKNRIGEVGSVVAGKGLLPGIQTTI